MHAPSRPDKAQLAAIQRAVAARRRWLASPVATRQRLDSRFAYRNLAPGAASTLVIRDFGRSLVGAADTPAANPAVEGHIQRYLNPDEAIITSSTGVRTLAISSVPLLVPAAGRRPKPVNLYLRRTAGGLKPANPLVPVLIGGRLGDGVAVGDDGLRLTLQGADVSARLVNGSRAFFANVATDTDAVASPTSTGAELSAVLRSPRSPEELRYAVSLPHGFSLVRRMGGAAVVRGSRTLAEISEPVAVDAQGSAVPVTTVVAGDTLVLNVAHRSASYAYPVLVDPQVGYSFSPTSGNWTESGPFISQNKVNYGNTDPYDITASAGGYLGSSSDWVSWEWVASPGVVDDNQTVSWSLYDVYLADFDTTDTIQQAQINVSDTCYNWQGSITAGAGQVYSSGQVSGQMSSCSSGSTQPDVQNWILNRTGGATAGAVSQFGSFLFTLPCSSGCSPSNGPSGSALWGDWNPAGPVAPRPICGKPVDCENGNQFEVQTDLTIPGRGLGLDLIRTYNSQAAAQGISGPFGAGWTSSYSDSLTINQSAGTATVTQANGSTVPFTISGSSFVAPPWAHATLVQNGDGTYTYTLANQDSFHFDANGRLLSEADRNGETDTVGYDSGGRLATITDPAGRIISLAYNSAGMVASATDSGGRVVYYAYSDGNLVGVTDADGSSWSFGYDASHQMTSMTDPLGHTITTTYNSSNQVATQTDAAGRKRTWTYSPGETLIQNPDGTETNEQFTNNLPSSITYAYGTSLAATTTLAYDANYDLEAVTDPNGNVTSYIFDGNGNLLRETDPLGRVTKWTYDSLNDVTSMTDPLGNTTSYTYDSHGNLLSISRPLVGSGQTQTTTYTRGDSSHPGDVTAITDPDSNTTSYGYDSYGDVTSVTDPLGNETTYGYDSLGRMTSMVSPRGNVSGVNPAAFTTTYTYDPLSRMTSETDPLGHTQSWSYDGAGNLVTYRDAEGHAITYSYDSDNELTQVTRPDDTTLQSTYDAAGNLTSQTDGDEHKTTYGYDALEQLVSVTDPLSRDTTYAYDADGDLTGVTDPANRTTTYGYDADNELTSISYSDGQTPDVSYSYDADGQRTGMSDGSGASSYTYDSLNRLTATKGGTGNTIGYGYDLADNVTAITYPSGQAITRSFDADERLASVTDWLGNETSFVYGPDSNLKTITFPSATGDVDTYTYDDADQINGVQMAQGATTLASLAYTREPDGTLASDAETGLPEPSLSETRGYSYDNADNVTEIEGSSGYTYDQADELTASPGYTYAYDQLGERTTATSTSGPSVTYAYDQAGLLASVTPSGGTPTTFAYNGDGLRTSETTGTSTQTFTWDQSGSLPLILTDGQNSYIYGPDDLPIEQISNSGTPTYLHEDQLGSIRLITSQNGNPAGSFTYNPYGALVASSGTATSPFGYAGEYTDQETGLQYDEARYYDPVTGQFLTRDPLVAQTWEAYTYTAGNPVNGTDPSGMDATGLPSPDGALTNVDLPSPKLETPGPDIKAPHPLTITLNPDTPELTPPTTNNDTNSTQDTAEALAQYEEVLCNPLDYDSGSTIVTAEEPGASSDENGEPNVTVDGHGARHLAGTGLDQADVEAAIEAQVKDQVSRASATGSFWGRVEVDGQTIEYRAYTLPNGTINVGTYYAR